MAELNYLEDERPLTKTEQSEQLELLAGYERFLLYRAQAFAVLVRRGRRLPAYPDLAPPAQ